MLGHQIESDDHREKTIDLITEAPHSTDKPKTTSFNFTNAHYTQR